MLNSLGKASPLLLAQSVLLKLKAIMSFEGAFNLKSVLLLREAFMSLLPIVLVMNILVLLSGLTGLLESWGVTGAANINGDELGRLYYFLIPLFVNLSLSTILAKEKELDQIGTLLIALVCFFRVTGFLNVSNDALLTSYQGTILTSIPCTWMTVRLLHYFSKFPRTRLIARQSDINPRLKRTLNLVVPGLLAVLCAEAIRLSIKLLMSAGLGAVVAQALPKFDQLNAVSEIVLFKAIALSTWFIGLHGEHSADGLFRLMNDIAVGDGYSIELKVFHNVFMNIGGSGATFVIPFLVLFSKRLTHFKSIAQLSVPFSFFNVNEILLFGLPILLNPIFLIPFLGVPFVNMAIALTSVKLGISPLPSADIHWMAPPLYSAYVATNGSIGAVITQLLCLVVDGFIYFPFLALAGRQYQAPLYLLKLFGEDAYGFINEEINHQQERLFMAKQRDIMRKMTSAQRVLKQLQGGQFVLYFQPKFDATTLNLVGLEALLRFQNHKGDILPPTFLPVLYQQGLSKVVDKKVVNLVFWQILRWRAIGLQVPPIAINFDKDFLLDSEAVQKLISRAQQHDIQFCIEITEHTYTIELTKLASVIQQFRAAGHRISIDDFGAGYSSLTSLLALDADEIKLDRKLVVPPETEARRGHILLASSIQLCHELGFSVVAEGVETPEQMALVQQCGADVVQGYYLGRPMASQQVSQLFDPVATLPSRTYLSTHPSSDTAA